MILEIPFNEKIYRRQQTLNFELLFREKINKTNTLLLLFILLAIISTAVVFTTITDLIDVIPGLLVFLLLYVFIKQKLAYSKFEKKYFQILEEEIEKNKHITTPSFLEFNKDYIRWEDYRMNVQFNWEMVPQVRFVEDTLFFDILQNTTFLIISADEINDKHYQELFNILTSKNLINNKKEPL